MRILWIADFNLDHNSGGAQRTNDYVIKEAENRGHEVQQLNYDTQRIPGDPSDYDVVVTNNIDALQQTSGDTALTIATNHKFHVRFEHDANRYLTQDRRKALFGSAKHNIFLSDYHIESFKNIYGDIFPNASTVYPYISKKAFKDEGGERLEKTLYIGFLHHLKGAANFLSEVLKRDDEEFAVAGWSEMPHWEFVCRNSKNVEFIGKVSHDMMPFLLNKYKRVFYKPVIFEPFCRSIGEAMFSGMELDCSDNIGAIRDANKYGVEALRELCDKSPSRFWDLVEGSV